MPVTRFVKFYQIAPECQSSTGVKCAALRCGEIISPDDTAKIQDLLVDRLLHIKKIDSAYRVAFLEQIARLNLCEEHVTHDNIEAAALQWEKDVQTQARPVNPKTPVSKNDINQLEFKFSNYYTPATTDKLQDPKNLDLHIKKKLANIKGSDEDKKPGYIYVFSRGNANEGFYKVGFTDDISTRTEDLAKCFGDLTLHCLIHCPNARFFEDAVHAELAQYRRKYACINNGCKTKEHGEWFDASLQDILDSVSAWGLYARMFYRYGLSIDKYNHTSPMPGFSSHSNRWRRWALKETVRWMYRSHDQPPSTVSVQEETVTSPIYDSNPESVPSASSPPDLSYTPGPTPADSPDATPEFDRPEYGYLQTPTKSRGDLVIIQGDNGNEGEEEFSPEIPRDKVRRNIFPGGKTRNLPGRPPNLPHSMESQPLRRKVKGGADPFNTNQVSGASSTDRSPDVRGYLKDAAQRDDSNASVKTLYLKTHGVEEGYHRICCSLKGGKKDRCFPLEESDFQIKNPKAREIRGRILEDFKGGRKLKCEKCDKDHVYWVHAPLEEIKEKIRAQAKRVQRSDESTSILEEGVPQDSDRRSDVASEGAAEDHGEICSQEGSLPDSNSRPIFKRSTTGFSLKSLKVGGDKGKRKLKKFLIATSFMKRLSQASDARRD